MKKKLFIFFAAVMVTLFIQFMAIPVIMAAGSALVITVTPESGEEISHIYSVSGVAVQVSDSDGDLGEYKAEYFWSRSSNPNDKISSLTPGSWWRSLYEEFSAYAPYPLEGRYYLHITSVDLAGHKTVKTAGPYNIDAGVAPVVEFKGGDPGVVQESHTVKVLAHDFSGLSSASYARWITINDDGSETPSVLEENVIPGNDYDAPPMVGKYKLEVYVKDNMANEKTYYSDVFEVGHPDGSPIIHMRSSEDEGGAAPSASLMQNGYVYDDVDDAESISVYYKWSRDGQNEPLESEWITGDAPGAIDGSVYFSIFNPDPGEYSVGTWYCWVKAVDSDGNTSIKRSSGKLLDLVPPEINISYYPSLNHPTAGPVRMIMDFGEEIQVFNVSSAGDFASWEEMMSFTENGERTFEAQDLAGNWGSVTASVYNVDNTLPRAAGVTYSTEDFTNDSVTAAVYAGNGCYFDMLPQGVSVTETVFKEGQEKAAAFTYTFNDNGGIEYKIIDPSTEKQGWGSAAVDWIDKTPPVPVLYYSKSASEVRVGVDPWTSLDYESGLDFDRLPADYTFTENGTHDFTVYDCAGNEASITAVVDWLTPPDPLVSYSRTTTGSLDSVTASITFPDAQVPVYILGNLGMDVFNFSLRNERRDFIYMDANGNSSTVTAVVDWVGNNAASIHYSTTGYTSGPVTATLVPGDGWNLTVTNNGGSFEKVFDHNGSFVFQYQTLHEGTGSIIASVNNILEHPVPVISYSITETTNQDVTATLELHQTDGSVYPADEVTITNNGGSNKYTFTQNGTFTFLYETSTGLTGSAEAIVDWIDKQAPEAPTVEYSTTEPTKENVVVTFIYRDGSEPVTVDEFNEPFINVLEAGKRYEFINNGSHTFIFRDGAGNSVSREIYVDWIDRTPISGDITYTPTQAAYSVTASLAVSKDNCQIYNEETNGWEAVINRTVHHLFLANGSHTFQVRDVAGNEATFVATVTWIVDENIVPKITYTPSSLTNTDVQAELIFVNKDTGEEANISPYSVSDAVYTFQDNGVHTFTYTDVENQIFTIEAQVDWIDKIPPEGTISYTPAINTKYSVQAVVTAWDDRGGSITFSPSDRCTFNNNGSYIFEFEDEAGNSTSLIANVNWIKTACIPEISYSTESPTKEEVSARITFPGWTNMEIINNEGKDSYTFTENGEFTFQYRDPDGDTGSFTAKVDWIDRTAPTGKIYYTPNTKTSGNVSVQIALQDNISSVSNIKVVNNNGSDTYIFTDNGSFDFIIEDEAGNQATVTAIVNWIDREVSQNAYVEYSTTQFTRSNVTAQVVFDDLDEEIYFDDPYSGSHVFSKNGSYTFNYRDTANNWGSVTAEVYWIDKNLPVMDIDYSKETVTNEDVTVTVTGTDSPADGDYAMSGINGFSWTKVQSGDYVSFEDQGEGRCSFVFKDNGKVEVTLTDKAGNEKKEEIQVNWIDRDAPFADVVYSPLAPTNQNVNVTISLRDAHATTITNVYQLPEYIQADPNNNYDYCQGPSFNFTFTGNGSFVFIAGDQAGNILSVPVEVTNIIREVPEVEVSYSTEENTPYYVTAFLRTKEAVRIDGVNEEAEFIYDESDRFIYTQLKHTFYENGDYTFVYQDTLGNQGEAAAGVSWIENKAPEVYVEYNRQHYTNQPVEARIRLKNDYYKGFNITNNNDSDTYTFTENGTFVFRYANNYGAEGEIEAKVDWIDKTPPAFDHFEYTPGGLTPKPSAYGTNIKIYAKDDESGPVPDWGHYVTENGDYQFDIADYAGNKSTVYVTVDWIDKTPPDLNITGDFNTITNQNVAVTISANEDVTVNSYYMPYERQGYYNISVDQADTLKTDHTATLKKNGIYRITCLDEAGNETKFEIEVTNIDKAAPVVSSAANQFIVIDREDEDKIIDLLEMQAVDSRDGDLTGEIDYVLATSEIGEDGDEVRVYACSVKDGAGNSSEAVTRTVVVSAKTRPAFYIDGEAAGGRLTRTLAEGETSTGIALDCAGFYGDYVLKITTGERPAAFFKSALTSNIFYSSKYSVGKLSPLVLGPGVYTIYGYDAETGYVTLVIEVKEGE